MALEMEDALSGNIAELANLDFVEGVFAHMKARKRLVAGRIARMDDCTLVQVPAIDFNRIVHIDLEFTRECLCILGAAARICGDPVIAG
jgi:hypothetical protein